jgi:hypothetical protein
MVSETEERRDVFKIGKGGLEIGSVVECLPSMNKALVLIPSTANK